MNVQNGAPSSGIYHLLWRWHFYAGLFVAPFIVILALTGAIYLFNDEIEGVLYRNLFRVDPPQTVVAASVQEAAALAAHEGAEVSRYETPRPRQDAPPSGRCARAMTAPSSFSSIRRQPGSSARSTMRSVLARCSSGCMESFSPGGPGICSSNSRAAGRLCCW